MAILECKTEHQDGLSLVTLEVEGKPTISLQRYIGLVETLISEANKPHVSVILLTAPPEKFFFGMDLEEIEKLKTGAAIRGTTASIQDMLNELETSPAALICAVDGQCYGGGLEMILAFHVILATPSSMFGLPEIKVGTIPSYGGTQRLARIVGRNRALRVMLTGEAFSAEVAEKWGLVSEVVPRQNLLSTATKLAKRLAGLSRPAVRALLNATIGGLDVPMHAGLNLESMNSSGLAGSPDLEEGIRAFFEKRRPVFPSTINGKPSALVESDHGH